MINNKQSKREAKQLFHLCKVDSLLQENRVRQVVDEVIAAGRRNSAVVLGEFLRLVRLDTTQHAGTVESATPLPVKLQVETQASLTHLYGPGLTTTFSCRPSLIAGMRIQVGSDVYDCTVQARLAALEKCFDAR